VRSFLIAGIAFIVGCSRAPDVNLAEVSSGEPFEADARHALVIKSDGSLSLDGQTYARDKELVAALGRLGESMESEIDPRAGVRLATEPLALWIDRDAPFEVVEPWIEVTCAP
jgi:hypothetical protein